MLVRRPAEPDVAAAHDEPMTREEFAARYAASPDDAERIEAFAQQFELHRRRRRSRRGAIVLAGTIAAMNEAFGTTLQLYQCEDGRLSRPDRGALPAGRSEGRRRRRLRPRQSSAGAGALPPTPRASLTPRQPATRRSRRRRSPALPVSDARDGRRARPSRSSSSAAATRPPICSTYFARARPEDAVGDGRLGRRREERADRRSRTAPTAKCCSTSRSSARSRRRARSRSTSRRTPTRDSSTRSRPRCTTRVRKPAIVSISWGGPESAWTPQALTRVSTRRSRMRRRSA